MKKGWALCCLWQDVDTVLALFVGAQGDAHANMRCITYQQSMQRGTHDFMRFFFYFWSFDTSFFSIIGEKTYQQTKGHFNRTLSVG